MHFLAEAAAGAKALGQGVVQCLEQKGSVRLQCGGGGDKGRCAPMYLCGICFPGQKMPCVCVLSKCL